MLVLDRQIDTRPTLAGADCYFLWEAGTTVCFRFVPEAVATGTPRVERGGKGWAAPTEAGVDAVELRNQSFA